VARKRSRKQVRAIKAKAKAKEKNAFGRTSEKESEGLFD